MAMTIEHGDRSINVNVDSARDRGTLPSLVCFRASWPVDYCTCSRRHRADIRREQRKLANFVIDYSDLTKPIVVAHRQPKSE